MYVRCHVCYVMSLLDGIEKSSCKGLCFFLGFMFHLRNIMFRLCSRFSWHGSLCSVAVLLQVVCLVYLLHCAVDFM